MELSDTELLKLLQAEESRQQGEISLIPSENYASFQVRQILASRLTNKYAEGYPGKRYYAGNRFIDEIENLARERAMRLFGTPHANVQAYSGSPANLAVYMATCQLGDVVMGLALPDGGHLTHGWPVSITGSMYKPVQYHVLPDGRIDIDEVWRLAKEHRPKLIWVGATAYPYILDFEKFAEIADSVGAYLAADIAHVAGLIVGGVYPSPVPFVHVVTTTTHKTLRGPRGGMIMTTQKGLDKDNLLAEKIDKAVFPGLQGGPHENQVAAVAEALFEASQPEFSGYAQQVVQNAKVLAGELTARGFNLVGGGTENHLLLMDLTDKFGPGGGIFMHEALEAAGINTNKNTVPGDKSSPFYPSGLRLGTPAVTTCGMGAQEMVQIAEWISQVFRAVENYRLPEDKAVRSQYLQDFRVDISNAAQLQSIRSEVAELCKRFPCP